MMGQLVRAVVRGLGSKLRVSLASYSVVSIIAARDASEGHACPHSCHMFFW